MKRMVAVLAFLPHAVHVNGATLHITGSEKQVVFGDGTTAFATLSGGEGFINSTVNVSAPDFVTMTGTSLNNMMTLIRAQQVASIAHQAEIDALKELVGMMPSSAPPTLPPFPPSFPPFPPGTDQPTYADLATRTFNGSMSSVIHITDPGACASGNSPRTIMMWLNTNANTNSFGSYGLIDPVGCAGPAFNVHFNGGSTYGISGGCRGYVTSGPWPNSAWHHFAFTYDGGTSRSSSAAMYVDGNKKNPLRNTQGFNGHDIENGLQNDCSPGVYYGGYEAGRIMSGMASGFRFFNNSAISQATVQFFMGLDDPRS
jgi:hypothetical protein